MYNLTITDENGEVREVKGIIGYDFVTTDDVEEAFNDFNGNKFTDISKDAFRKVVDYVVDDLADTDHFPTSDDVYNSVINACIEYHFEEHDTDDVDERKAKGWLV